MRFLRLLGILPIAVCAAAQTPAAGLWAQLQENRERLPSVHQVFDVSQKVKTAVNSQTSIWQLVLDMSAQKWREESVTQSGTHIRLFDGTDLLLIEAGSTDFRRMKRKAKDLDPIPNPYNADEPDWAKAVEANRRSCGDLWKDHLCVLVDVPLKQGSRHNGGGFARLVEGNARLLVDAENGLILTINTMQLLEDHSHRWRADTTYTMKEMKVGETANAGIFKSPAEGSAR